MMFWVVGIFSASVYVYTLLRRLYLSPLSKYSGPRLAAASSWYRIYHDMYLRGRWVDQLHELHSTYGPVVRVGPNEISFSDLLAYNDIYTVSGSAISKDPRMYASFDIPQSTFATTNTFEAMKAKQGMASFFSRRAILRLESVIQSQVDKLVERLAAFETEGRPANLHRAFRSTTLDLISSYCFATSPETLDAPDFMHPMIITMESSLKVHHLLKHFPVARYLLLRLPYWLAIRMNPTVKATLDGRMNMLKQIDQIMANPTLLADKEHPTIFHGLLDHSTQAGYSRHRIRKILRDEGIMLRSSGSDTVGASCTMATVFLLRDDERRKLLVDELKAAWPDKDMHRGYEALEKLPYLTAVIKETLRIGYVTASPLLRTVGPDGAVIAGHFIPAGTTVSIPPTLLHLNENVFHEPHKFMPERWLDPTNSAKLDKFLVTFSRGPRACLGINLAWCELYLILGHVFRKLELSEDQSQPADLRFSEFFLTLWLGTKLHAFVKSRGS